ncbi:RimJ/RimL family protein N-acetyltransferase [Crossiella equi]|uniref:RimJ/RimL family protein N-acetyltransferase n=1 Tax=Crossiella equi TaxID=130796 RepID=A0ABS5AFA0_9PSEU|nr:RimJ/RimL family protein N-acetyltransferase [Crossiella equi]
MDIDWWRQPTLTGTHVRLEPLSLDHAEDLHEAGRDPAVWAWLSHRWPSDLAGTVEFVHAHLTAQADGDRLVYAQIDLATGKAAGVTSYYEIVPAHRALAIGHTWIGTPWQRTGLNTESKLLLLARAFEQLSALRVVWHTDNRNQQSQRAIERLGAQREGLLRHHRVRPDGTLRDTVQYSMLAEEWPGVRERLRARLDRAAAAV